MISPRTVLMGLAFAGLASLVSCKPLQRTGETQPEPPPPSPAEHRGKVLMMHYMPWYETPEIRGQWGSHWTGHKKEHRPGEKGPDGLPDIWSHYHPLIGLYDSTDPAVLECHLLEMKLAGVDGVIVDWYGIGKSADYPPIHTATRAMFDAAGRHGMRFAACYEDRSLEYMQTVGELKADGAGGHLADTFRWMEKEWFSAPHYLRREGRPVVLNFGPVHLKDPAPWAAARAGLKDPPLLFGLHHLWKNAGFDGGFTWVHWEPWDGGADAETVKRRLLGVHAYPARDPNRVIVSAFPGFNDVYEVNHRVLDHRAGATFRESLAAAMASASPVVQLVTWNDYGEGTMIEPTHEFGYTFLEVILAARRTELGDVIRTTPADLRLPARLFALRKRGDVPVADLDRVSRLLTSGSFDEARATLDRLDR